MQSYPKEENIVKKNDVMLVTSRKIDYGGGNISRSIDITLMNAGILEKDGNKTLVDGVEIYATPTYLYLALIRHDKNKEVLGGKFEEIGVKKHIEALESDTEHVNFIHERLDAMSGKEFSEEDYNVGKPILVLHFGEDKKDMLVKVMETLHDNGIFKSGVGQGLKRTLGILAGRDVDGYISARDNVNKPEDLRVLLDKMQGAGLISQGLVKATQDAVDLVLNKEKDVVSKGVQPQEEAFRNIGKELLAEYQEKYPPQKSPNL